jgi:hypothetical protein
MFPNGVESSATGKVAARCLSRQFHSAGSLGAIRKMLHRLTLPSTSATIQSEERADVAQLVEQLIRNQQVVSSSLTVGSILSISYLKAIN